MLRFAQQTTSLIVKLLLATTEHVTQENEKTLPRSLGYNEAVSVVLVQSGFTDEETRYKRNADARTVYSL